MFCTLSPSSKNHMDVRGCFMIRQGCCWTGYSEQSYSSCVGIAAPSLLSFTHALSFSFPPLLSFFLSSFFLHQTSVREERGRMLSFSLCQNSPTGLGFNLLLISLANPFPLLARISPGISKETVNYVGYSFICSFLQCFKKKKTKTKNTTEQLCAHAVQ